MARLAAAVARAGRLSGGLVDATLADEIRAAGYEHDLDETLALERALCLAPRRAPAGRRHGRHRCRRRRAP